MSDLWSESVTGTVAVGQTCSLLYLCPGNKCVCVWGGGGILEMESPCACDILSVFHVSGLCSEDILRTAQPLVTKCGMVVCIIMRLSVVQKRKKSKQRDAVS